MKRTAKIKETLLGKSKSELIDILLDLYERRGLDILNPKANYLPADNLGVGTLTCDANGNIISISSGCAEILGIDAETPAGNFYDSDRLEFIDEFGSSISEEGFPINAVFNRKKSIRNFVIGRKKSGYRKIRWFLSNAAASFDESGNLTGVSATFNEITERKQAESELLESRAKIYAILEAAPNAIITIGSKGRISSFNPMAEKIFKYPPEEIIGKKISALFADVHNLDDIIQPTSGARETGKIVNKEIRAVRKGDEIFPAELSSAAFKVRKEIRYALIIRDITARKENERKLLESERKYRNLFENAQVGLFRTKADGSAVLDVNTKLCEIFGFSKEEFLASKSIKFWRNNSDRDKLIKILFEKRSINDYEGEFLARDGSVKTAILSVVYYPDIEVLEGSLLDITDRKIYETALKESEEKFRQIAENVNEVFWLRTSDEMIYVNKAYENVFGRTRQSLYENPHTFLEAVAPEDRKRIEAAYLSPEFAATGRFDEKYRILTPDGKTKWIRAVTTPVFNENGDLTTTVGVAEDITQNVEAIESLKRSEALLQESQKLARLGNWLWDIKTNEIIWSENVYRIFGAEKGEFDLTLDAYMSLIHDEDSDRVWKTIESAMSEGSLYRVEHRIVRPDGKPAYLRAIGKVETDPKGEAIRVFGAVQDVTDEKISEEKLEKSLSLAQTMLAYVNEGVLVFDSNGTLTARNDRAIDILSLDPKDLADSREETIVINISKKIIGAEEFKANALPVLDNPKAEMKVIVDLKNYTVAELSVKPQTSGDKIVGRVWIFKDITDWIRTKERLIWYNNDLETAKSRLEDKTIELRKTVQELERAKLAAESADRAKSVFLAGVSHEFRTPLNSIIGFAEALFESPDDSSREEYVETILSAARSLLLLINDILDISKIESGKLKIEPSAMSLRKLVAEVGRIFELSARKKGLSLRIEIAPNVPGIVFLDEVRIRQILFNLLGNAVKFTDSGAVDLAVSAERNSEKTADLLFEVRDTGIGIPEEDLNTIFEIFKQREGQDRRKYGGTGLGLAITKRLVEMMDGDISVESRVGSGTKFSFELKDVSIERNAEPSRDYRIEEFDDISENIDEKVEANLEKELSEEELEIVKNTISPEMINEFNEIKELNSVGRAETFGEKLKEIGRSSGSKFLKIAGDRLSEAARKFDPDKMQKIQDLISFVFDNIKDDSAS